MQTIPINMMAYRHEVDADGDAKRRRGMTLDRFGYIGFTKTDEFGERYEHFDRYPRANADLDVFGGELPTRKNSVLFGVSSVTGHLPGRNCETFTVGGTANVLNTGKYPISQWDEVCVVVCYPNDGDRSDYVGQIGTKEPSVNRDHLTAFTIPSDKLRETGFASPDDDANVFVLGTALMNALPGQMCGVLLARPSYTPVLD